MFTLPRPIAERLKALILILMAIFFTQKFVSGELYYYIGPRFAWLTLVGVMLLILLAGAIQLALMREAPHAHEHPDHAHHHDPDRVSVWTLLIVALPLILGVAVPARPLDASAVSARGVSTSLTSAADVSGSLLAILPSERNVLDWVRVMSSNPDPASLDGVEAEMLGFVYRDIRFSAEQFMVSRFTLSCCVADATAIGVVVQDSAALEFETNQWVLVRGTFTEGTLDGMALPVLIAEEIIPVQEPEQPYLFP
jgi:uncharacterized repeat protein (TIGR03943 family)